MEKTIRLVVDEEVRAAYLYLVEGKQITRTVPLVVEFEGDDDVGWTINVDLADDGTIVGIEIIGF